MANALSVDAQMHIFKNLNPAEILFNHIKNGVKFCNDALIKILELPEAEALMIAYTKTEHPIGIMVQLKIFEYPFAENIISAMINNGYFLYTEPEVKMLHLPNAEKLLAKYLELYSLEEDAQLELFKLPNSKNLVSLFIKKRDLCENAEIELCMVDWPEKNELIDEHIALHGKNFSRELLRFR